VLGPRCKTLTAYSSQRTADSARLSERGRPWDIAEHFPINPAYAGTVDCQLSAVSSRTISG